jgi:hypothetical protein
MRRLSRSLLMSYSYVINDNAREFERTSCHRARCFRIITLE